MFVSPKVIEFVIEMIIIFFWHQLVFYLFFKYKIKKFYDNEKFGAKTVFYQHPKKRLFIGDHYGNMLVVECTDEQSKKPRYILEIFALSQHAELQNYGAMYFEKNPVIRFIRKWTLLVDNVPKLLYTFGIAYLAKYEDNFIEQKNEIKSATIEKPSQEG